MAKDNEFSNWDARETAKSLIQVSPYQNMYHLRVAIALLGNIDMNRLLGQSAASGGSYGEEQRLNEIIDDLADLANEIDAE